MRVDAPPQLQAGFQFFEIALKNTHVVQSIVAKLSGQRSRER